MHTRALGTTGLQVPALGLGAGSLGDPALPESRVRAVLDRALALGVTLIDSAPSYGLSEARIGRWLGPRRQDVLLSTKVGYGVPGVPDWTPRAVTAGVDAALTRLGTDWLDLVHLHSCTAETLAWGGVLEALDDARQAGKVRVVSYAGDGAGVDHAVRSGLVGAVMPSASVLDQGFLRTGLGAAKDRGLGVVAKRPLATAPWRHRGPPGATDQRTYWDRLQALGLDFGPDWPGIALRFVAFTWGIDAVLTGTTDPEHLAQSAAAVALGPLPDAQRRAIEDAWSTHGCAWPPVV